MKKLIVPALLLTCIVGSTVSSLSNRLHIESQLITNDKDSLAIDRAKYVAEINESIKGKEDMVVDSVFKNLQYIGGFKAAMLPVVMEHWSKALGVSCNHCHVKDKWEVDDKPEKKIARQMAELSQKINKDLAAIDGMKNLKPIINCTTCHRGELKPALNINN
ncbi:MAG: c-type cytochrome [Bacteroidota bacterium]